MRLTPESFPPPTRKRGRRLSRRRRALVRLFRLVNHIAAIPLASLSSMRQFLQTALDDMRTVWSSFRTFGVPMSSLK
jgi:hypothetical protein